MARMVGGILNINCFNSFTYCSSILLMLFSLPHPLVGHFIATSVAVCVQEFTH